MAVCTTGAKWGSESAYFSWLLVQIVQAIFWREIKFRDGSGIAKAGEGNQAFAPLNRMTYKQVDAEGGTHRIADPRRGDGKRYVLRADEKPTAFCGIRIGLQRSRQKCLTKTPDFFKTAPITDLNSG